MGCATRSSCFRRTFGGSLKLRGNCAGGRRGLKAIGGAQVGTVTGALNFFRARAASFTVAAFPAILLMALGADISLSGEHRDAVNAIAAADMVAAIPLRARRGRGDDGVHDAADGGEAAGGAGAGGDGGVGGSSMRRPVRRGYFGRQALPTARDTRL
jgi:hypothetical protein